MLLIDLINTVHKLSFFSFREVKDFLGEKPFEDYQHTMYFARYLQWKWLER